LSVGELLGGKRGKALAKKKKKKKKWTDADLVNTKEKERGEEGKRKG